MDSEVTLVKKLKQGLGCIRELTAVLEVLVRALDPCKQSDITEDMDSEGTTETFTDSETQSNWEQKNGLTGLGMYM